MKAQNWFFGCLLIVGTTIVSCSDATAGDDAVYDEIQSEVEALDKDEIKEEDT